RRGRALRIVRGPARATTLLRPILGSPKPDNAGLLTFQGGEIVEPLIEGQSPASDGLARRDRLRRLYQLKYCALAVRAAIFGRAVEVPRRVPGYSGSRICAVGAMATPLSAKVVQHLFCPRSVVFGCQLEHCAAAVLAALFGRAVEIARRVPGQAGFRVAAISAI